MRKKTFRFYLFILIFYIAISLSSSTLAQVEDEGSLSYGEVIDVDISRGLIVVKDLTRHRQEENVFSYSGETYIYNITPETVFLEDKSWLDVQIGKIMLVCYVEGDFGERIAKFINFFSELEEGVRIAPNE